MLSLSKVLMAIPTERIGCALVELTGQTKVRFSASRRIYMHYVLQGPLVVERASATQVADTGDFICLPRGVAHHLGAADADSLFRTDLLERLAPTDEPAHIRFGPAQKPTTGRLLSGSYSLRGSGGLAGSLMADVSILRMGDGPPCSLPPPPWLVEACEGAGAGAFAAGWMRMLFFNAVRLDVARRLGAEEADFDSKLANKIGRAQMLLERYPGEAWSVAQLAQTVGMARSSFAQQFVAKTGQSPMAMLAASRMAEGERLLAEQMGVGEIARALGYGSLTAFSRAFRRRHGISPSGFRKRLFDRRSAPRRIV